MVLFDVKVIAVFENQNQPDDQWGDVHVSSSRLFGLLMLGFILVFIGVIVLMATTIMNSGGSSSVGGVVFIGPIPIVFGAGPNSDWLILTSIVIAVAILSLFFIFYRRARRVIG